ncbi:MAG TPA: alpha/beta fold hydrolase [Candidatus Binataceae bacterium]
MSLSTWSPKVVSPDSPETREPASGYSTMRILRIGAWVVAVLFILTIARLAQLDKGGPSHSSFELPGRVPATFYLPGAANPFFTLFPKPVDQRPAAVVLVHGFMSDRQMMSALARRITQNGYAVLAIDVRGHGANRNPFYSDNFVAPDALSPDIKAAVDFLRSSERVDGSRIVVMGHSMGAGATLEYATHDPGLRGAVMISGGWHLGPERPKNALFIFAQHDPEEAIQQTSSAIAAHLAGVPQIDLGKVYGDFKQGNAVEAVRIPGVNHVQIITSAAAATTIVQWLDSTFGTARTGAIDVSEPRLVTAGIALVLFLILLVPIGRICGSMTRYWSEPVEGLGGWIGVAIIGGALLAAMPLVAMIPPAELLSVVVGDVQTSWFAVAGLIAIAVLVLAHVLEWRRIRDGLAATLFAAALGFAVIYVCQVAMAVAFHRESLTPERLVVAILATLATLPFWLGFEFLIRRGGLAIATTRAVIARALIIVLMAAGAILQVLPFVVMLILPSLALVFVLMEIFAASAYSTSRNLVLITLVEAAWFAWIMAATSPITFMF